jgi:hypothetical protein
VVETNSYGLCKNFQFEYCRRLPLPHLVLFVFSSAEWFGTEFRVVFSSAKRFRREFREFASVSVPRNGIPSCFSSAEGFGREFRKLASISVPRNGFPRCFLFRGRVRNGIPRNSVPRYSRNSVGNNHLFRQFRLPRNYFFVGNSQPYIQVGQFRIFSKTRGDIRSSRLTTGIHRCQWHR